MLCSHHCADTRAAVDFPTFLQILNRPNGFKPAGTPGVCGCARATDPAEEFVRGFQVFDKEGNGFIGEWRVSLGSSACQEREMSALCLALEICVA